MLQNYLTISSEILVSVICCESCNTTSRAEPPNKLPFSFKTPSVSHFCSTWHSSLPFYGVFVPLVELQPSLEVGKSAGADTTSVPTERTLLRCLWVAGCSLCSALVGGPGEGSRATHGRARASIKSYLAARRRRGFIRLLAVNEGTSNEVKSEVGASWTGADTVEHPITQGPLPGN